jgi:hypothetical protein
LNYTAKALKELHLEFSGLLPKYSDLAIGVGAYAESLTSERAKEFMVHGVGRRLWIIYRSIVNIFRLFHPEQIKPLPAGDRIDVEINHHAFLINVYGILENLALAAAHEKNLIGKEKQGMLPPKDVSLFNKKLRSQLDGGLREYLSQSRIDSWYREYAKNYRDALAHRIPPYVPPSALNDADSARFKEIEREIAALYKTYDFDRIEALREEQDGLGRANPLFLHSFSENARPLYLHPQVLADFNTIDELVRVYIGKKVQQARGNRPEI